MIPSPKLLSVTKKFKNLDNRAKKNIKVGDLFDGFRKRKLKWNEVVFNKETIGYLKENINNLLEN